MAFCNSKCKEFLVIETDKKGDFCGLHKISLQRCQPEIKCFWKFAFFLRFEYRKLFNYFVFQLFGCFTTKNYITIERALKVVYQGHNSGFDECPEKGSSFNIHECNLQKLLIKVSKVQVNLAPEIIVEIFDIKDGLYPLRNKLRLKSWIICIVR